MTNIFVYGTLLFQEIVFALTGKTFRSERAVLYNYRRFRVFENNKPCAYPAILESEGDAVRGRILFDVDKESEDIIDFFEGSDYEKKRVIVESEGSSIEVFTYIWKNCSRSGFMPEWDENLFRDEYLDFYVNKKIPEILTRYKHLNHFIP